MFNYERVNNELFLQQTSLDIVIHLFTLPSVSLQSCQFFWWVFSFVVCKVRVKAARKLDQGLNRKWLGRGRGRRQWEKPSKKWKAFLIWLADRMSTCQQMSGSHIYKLQRSTISCNAAYLICVHSKKYLSSEFMAKICFFFLGIFSINSILLALPPSFALWHKQKIKEEYR